MCEGADALDAAAMSAWLNRKLALAAPGVAYVLHPGQSFESAAAVQQLSRQLATAGCVCTYSSEDMLVFDFIGVTHVPPAAKGAPTFGWSPKKPPEFWLMQFA